MSSEYKFIEIELTTSRDKTKEKELKILKSMNVKYWNLRGLKISE